MDSLTNALLSGGATTTLLKIYLRVEQTNMNLNTDTRLKWIPDRIKIKKNAQRDTMHDNTSFREHNHNQETIDLLSIKK